MEEFCYKLELSKSGKCRESKVQSCGGFLFSFLNNDVVFIDMGIFAEYVLFFILKNYLSGIIYLQCYISFECTT